MIKYYDSENPYRVVLTVRNRLGIHGRPALEISEAVKEFDGLITYQSGENSPVDASSPINILMNSTLCGAEVTFELFPNKPINSNNVDGLRKVIGKLENVIAHDDD